MISIEVFGYIGAALFAFCGLPQAIKSYRDGHAEGLAHLFLWMWFFGEVLTITYVYAKHGPDLPLIGNYSFNLILVIFIMRYKYFPRTLIEGIETTDVLGTQTQ